MSAPSRRPEIRRRRARKQKTDKLRTMYAAARSDSDRDRIVGKAQKMNPAFNLNQFLNKVGK